MESVLGRYRNLIILVGVLFLQVLGLAVQVKRSADVEHTRLIRVWAVDVVTPMERGLIWVQNGANNLWHDYFFLRGVRAENRELKDQIEKMRLDQVRISEDAAQAHRLQSLLAFKEQIITKTVPAQVIGSSGNDLSRSIYIDKGSNEGVAPDMAVITSGGIVGKVLRVYPSTSLVLLINDQSSGVGVLLEKSRLQGVLRGTPNGELVLERVMNDEQVAPGETVLSSGGDQIFPKGFPVGTVSKVSPGKEMFLNIQLKPAADLSRLEEVLVVTEKQEQAPVAENGGKVRAADILAQRLPSVPDKPAVVSGAAAKVASGATGLASGTAAKSQANGVKPVRLAPVKSIPEGLTPASTTAVSPVVPSGDSTPSQSSSGTNGAAASAEENSSSNSTTDAPKPGPAQAKPSGQQTTPPATPQPSPQSPQPPAAEDSPH
jgi:rod shape-determining protein MreC